MKKESIWSKDFIILFVGYFIQMCGQYLVNSLLSLYSKELGASDILVGSVVSVFYVVALACRPFSGPAMDAWNRKKLYFAMSVMSSACMFGYSMASSVTDIIVFRCLHGMSYGTLAALSTTMATQNVSVGSLTTAVTVFSLSSTLPMALGPALGLEMAEKFGYSFTYRISGVLMLAGSLVALFLGNDKRERLPYKLRLDTMISLPALVPMIVLAFIGGSYAAIQSFFALLVKSRNLSGLGGYYLASAIALVIVRPVAGKLADKYGAKKLLYIGLTFFSLELVFISLCSSEYIVFICGILHAMGYSSSYSIAQALAMKVTPVEKRGSASSTCFIGMDTGSFLGGFLWGAVAEVTDYASIFILAIVPQILSMVLLGVWYKKDPKTVNL